MKMDFWLNNVHREAEVQPDTLLLDLLRQMGCFSVKRGCETANCGLCTVLLEGRPVLSCSMLALRIQGKRLLPWKAWKKKLRSLAPFLQERGQSSAAFVIQGLL